MKLARIAIACSACLAGIAACSLIERPSDFFDPSGDIVTIASVESATTVADLVLTTDYVFFRADDAIYRVDKDGGHLVRFADGTGITHLASDGKRLVAWAETTNVHLRDVEADADTSNATAIAQSVATSNGRLAYTLAASDDDAGAFVEIATDAGTLGGHLPTPKIVVSAHAGAFYFFNTANAQVETTQKGPDTKEIGSTFFVCTFAQFAGTAFIPDRMVIDPVGSFAVLLENENNTARLFVGDAAAPPCCSDSTCAPTTFSLTAHETALYDGAVYTVTSESVKRYAASEVAAQGLPDGGFVVHDAGVASGASYPAIDGSFLYFVDGHKIQRLTLH